MMFILSLIVHVLRLIAGGNPPVQVSLVCWRLPRAFDRSAGCSAAEMVSADLRRIAAPDRAATW
jgi:hypothetical protein